MTPIDDLHVGQWVAITDLAEEDSYPAFGLFGMMPPTRRQSAEIDGRPLQIKAISLPFLCVSDGQHRFAVDVRHCTLQKLSKSYVKLLQGSGRREQGQFLVRDDTPPPKSETRDERACPNCGDRLIERSVRGTWYFACRQCGFEGGMSDGSAA